MHISSHNKLYGECRRSSSIDAWFHRTPPFVAPKHQSAIADTSAGPLPKQVMKTLRRHGKPNAILVVLANHSKS